MRISDWSSDVCSSDLGRRKLNGLETWHAPTCAVSHHRCYPLPCGGTLGYSGYRLSSCHDRPAWNSREYRSTSPSAESIDAPSFWMTTTAATILACWAKAPRNLRSEERSVGKACGSTCRSRWSRYH